LLVNIRPRQLKSVLDQLEARFGVASHEHFDHVEAEKNVRIIQQAQPGQPALRNASLFLAIHRRNGPAKIFAGARFYFHENQRVTIAADNVDFTAAASAKIAVKNFVSLAAQETARQFFASRAAPKMFR